MERDLRIINKSTFSCDRGSEMLKPKGMYKAVFAYLERCGVNVISLVAAVPAESWRLVLPVSEVNFGERSLSLL